MGGGALFARPSQQIMGFGDGFEFTFFWQQQSSTISSTLPSACNTRLVHDAYYYITWQFRCQPQLPATLSDATRRRIYTFH